MVAKKKEKPNIYKTIAEETGGGLLKEVGHCKYFVDSGNLALNYLLGGKFCGGGYPGGKIIEVLGPPASSKSLLGWCFLAGCQRMGGVAVYLDCERSVNSDFSVKAAHINADEALVYEPVHIKQVERKIFNVTRVIRKELPDVPICFVWDSIGVSPTEREWRETGLPENCSKEQYKKVVGAKEQPGERAKAAGALLRKVQPFIDENDVTLFIINQMRYKIGVMFGDPRTGAGGGAALEYYISSRIYTSPQKLIAHKERKVPIGINLKFKNKKSRYSTPFLETEGIQLYFENGISPTGGMLSILLGAGRIKEAGKATYQVQEPWANGKELKFKSTKARNDVPIDLLLECPGLIDASSSKEVKDYLTNYGDALAITNSDVTAEVEDNEDSDLIEKLGLKKDDFDDYDVEEKE